MSTWDTFSGQWLSLPDVLVFGGQDRGELNCFDNFFRHPFSLGQPPLEYATIEHAFQSLKFKGTDDEHAERIRTAATPMEAKQLGQTQRLPKEALDAWREGGAERAMREAIRAKFSSPDLKAKLLATGERPLAEQVDDDPSWDDRRWGIGKDDGGQNKLGKILMDVRDELRQA